MPIVELDDSDVEIVSADDAAQRIREVSIRHELGSSKLLTVAFILDSFATEHP